MGLDPHESLLSELSNNDAEDIHHIKDTSYHCKRQDYPVERLIAVSREEHINYGDKKQYADYLFWMHYLMMLDLNRPINKNNFPANVFFGFKGAHYDTAKVYYEYIQSEGHVSCIYYNNGFVELSMITHSPKTITTMMAETKEEAYHEILYSLLQF